MSISPSEIRRNASRISGLTGDVRQVQRELGTQYRQVGEFWTGTASKTLQSEYPGLDGEIKALIRSLERLESGVERVASQVQRAEQERAEKKRLAEKLAAEKRERERKEQEERARSRQR
ncbi:MULTISPECIES: WXG100 family type VII secretion target [Paenibacillus]|uniref:WXG100 family type VII secretion target n=1 Tax=Paenibacillus TaxID=44249 RepID=UPI00168A889D|nr:MULTISPECIES: WXG100 family type VII secretion target [Paenibacillus]